MDTNIFEATKPLRRALQLIEAAIQTETQTPNVGPPYGRNIELLNLDPVHWQRKLPPQAQGILCCLIENGAQLTEDKLVELLGGEEEKGDGCVDSKYLRTVQGARYIYRYYRKRLIEDAFISVTD